MSRVAVKKGNDDMEKELAGTVGGAAAGRLAGAAIGSIVPGVGTAIGGLLGGFLGGRVGDKITDAAGVGGPLGSLPAPPVPGDRQAARDSPARSGAGGRSDPSPGDATGPSVQQ